MEDRELDLECPPKIMQTEDDMVTLLDNPFLVVIVILLRGLL